MAGSSLKLQHKHSPNTYFPMSLIFSPILDILPAKCGISFEWRKMSKENHISARSLFHRLVGLQSQPCHSLQLCGCPKLLLFRVGKLFTGIL